MNLLMISAWNQSGGAFLHRLFDGHPSTRAYPFELQLGTTESRDGLSGWAPDRYRWPRLPADVGGLPPDILWDGFIDQETKDRVFRPESSKFQAFDFRFDEDRARTAFAAYIAGTPRTTAMVVDAYIRSIFDGWSNRASDDAAALVVGHCPMAVIDADRALADMPDMRFLHVVRSPFTGLADTRRRIPDMTVERYCHRWGTVNLLGTFFAAKYPNQCRVLRYEQLHTDREPTLRGVCGWLAIPFDSWLLTPMWNGQALNAILPFGGVASIGADHEERCLCELTPGDVTAIVNHLGWQLDAIGYEAPKALTGGLR